MVDDTLRLVYETLTPLEKIVFDTLRSRPQPSSDLGDVFMRHGFSGSKANVRRFVYATKVKLDAFFATTEGLRAKRRFYIRSKQEGVWRLVEESHSPTGTEAFWSNHLVNGRRTCFVLEESTFMDPSRFRQDAKATIKGLNVLLRVGRELLPSFSLKALREQLTWYRSYLKSHVVDATHAHARIRDVQALLFLYEYFERWSTGELGCPPAYMSTFDKVASLNEDNLLLIGCAATDALITVCAGDLSFVKHVVDGVLYLRFGDVTVLYNTPMLEDGTIGEYVLASRRGSSADDRCFTSIEGRHPVAVQTVCEVLTNETMYERIVLPTIPNTFVPNLPRDFQLGFSVHISPTDEVKSIYASWVGVRADCDPELERRFRRRLRAKIKWRKKVKGTGSDIPIPGNLESFRVRPAAGSNIVVLNVLGAVERRLLMRRLGEKLAESKPL